MANIAIIPARGGSKRIPRKNIKPFLGKPIISYSIETAIHSRLFDMVMVSTDDEEIATISKEHGAEIPFYRSSDMAGDFSVTADVLNEVLLQLQSANLYFEYACCLYPTAPFISNGSLIESYELLIKKGYTSVFPVCQFSPSIFRSLAIKGEDKIEMLWPENRDKRSQDLPVAYYDAGQFYWIHVESFLKDPKLFTTNSGAIILDELEVQDIDNENDWKMAEVKSSLFFQNERKKGNNS